MRASPAFQVTLRRFGAWRVGVLVTVLAAMGAVAAWIATQARSPSLTLLLVSGVVLASVLAFGWSLVSLAPLSLRWNGQQWHLGPEVSMGDEPEQGALEVRIDLGAWMLLRFVSQSQFRRRVVWLPVQRRGLESHWHALRCAAYASPPGRGSGGSAEA